MTDNQYKLNEQLLNVVLSDKFDVEEKFNKMKYLLYIGAEANGEVFGKSILAWAKGNENVKEEILDFLSEKGATEWVSSNSQSYELENQFWDENDEIKSLEEVKTLIRKGACLGHYDSYRDNLMSDDEWERFLTRRIWQKLSIDEMNEILKMLPEGYEIEGSVDLCGRKLDELPDFSKIKVSRDFTCSENELTSLKGAPKYVGRRFYCDDNNLTSLEGAPAVVNGDFSCCGNKLTSLEGAPVIVGGDFYCSNNQLVSLDGGPVKVVGDFKCHSNNLTSLEGAPIKVGGDFDCSHNQLVSLDGGPVKVGGDFDCSHNQIVKRGLWQRMFGGRD